jgi:hypothetical protein
LLRDYKILNTSASTATGEFVCQACTGWSIWAVPSERSVVGYVFGRAGDGKLHVALVGDPENKSEWHKLKDVNNAPKGLMNPDKIF